MPRPTLVVIGWMAATAAAVGVATAGVSAVAGRVVDPLPPTVGRELADVAPTPGEDRPTGTPSTAPPSDPPAAPTPEVVEPSPSPTSPASSDDTPRPARDAEVRSYVLVGGAATLRFEPGRVTVVSAEPAQGFVLEVEGNGTAEVRVEFDSDDHRSRLRGSWEDGPRERIEEEADRDEGDEPDD